MLHGKRNGRQFQMRLKDGTIRIETINDLIEEGYVLRVHCNNSPDCYHSAEVDLPALADRIGADHSFLADSIRRYFKCSECGSRDIGFIVSPPTGPRG
jgi:hypothetical protein